jgi:DNA-binding NarL/FixJ family response regulator
MSKPISVLLIDDNPTFLRIARKFLQDQEDVEVVGTANGGEEGLARSLELRPQVILLDLAMGDMSGLDVLPKLLESLPETRIIALTMLDTDGYRKAAKGAGAADFVAKAAMGTDLIPAIGCDSNNHEAS